MIFTRRIDTRVRETGPVYLTEEGLERLKARLLKLKKLLPALIDETQKAAAYGDRSDNAEYKEAKHSLRRTEGQILSIEDRLKRVEVIKTDESLKGIVQIGSTVALRKADGTLKIFEILGRFETDPGSGSISNESPLGQAILGKKLGDKFNFKLPSGAEVGYEIAEVDNLKNADLLGVE